MSFWLSGKSIAQEICWDRGRPAAMSAQRELSLSHMIALYHGRACYLTWLAGRKNQSYEVITTTVAGGSLDCQSSIADFGLASAHEGKWQSAIENRQTQPATVVVLTSLHCKAATLKIP